MKKLLLFILLLSIEILPQANPIGWTTHYRLRLYAQNANPGHDSLNQNWKDIDSAIYHFGQEFVKPERYGAVGNGVANDFTALSSAIQEARDSSKILLLSKTYLTESKLNVDLLGGDITILGLAGSKIISSATVVTNDIKILEGNLHFYNGGVVSIDGLTLESNNASSVNYLCGLIINGCEKVILNNVTSKYAPFAGIRLNQNEYISIKTSQADSNLYAGIIVENAEGGIIDGNIFSYNGLTFPVNGYGLTLSHRQGVRIDNEGITISNNKAFYNLRKGIDVHGGISGKIVTNHVKGFGNSGIYALNEPGSDPDVPAALDTSWYKYVRDWIISNNTVENDSAWFITHGGITAASGADGIGIFVGSYDDNTLPGGSYRVINNIVRHCNTPYARGHIFAFATLGEPLDVISIKDNEIHDALVSPYWFDGAIAITGTVNPKLVEIAGNYISGQGDTIISVNVGDMVKVIDNEMQGSFNYDIAIDRELNQMTFNNTLNGERLPDMIDAFNGTLLKSLETGASSNTKDLLSIYANGSEDGIVQYDVKIIATESVSDFQGTYDFIAIAKNDALTAGFSTNLYHARGINGDPQSFEPSLSWVGGGDTRILRVTCNTNYTNYKIHVNISSWRLAQWQRE